MRFTSSWLWLFALMFVLVACEQQDSAAPQSAAADAGTTPEAASGTDADAPPDAAAFLRQAASLQPQFARKPALQAEAPTQADASSEAVSEQVDQGENEQAGEDGQSGDEQQGTGETEEKRVTGRVQPGATMAKLLASVGVGSVQDYVNAAARVFPLRAFKAGNRYVVCTDEDGRVCRFEYEVNSQQRLVVEGDTPRARMEKIDYDTELATCEGVIADSLFEAVADIGENPQLALKLVELFGSEINFLRHLREGDSFSMLVEKRFRDGEFKGYGRILAATFTNRGKTYEAWLYPDPSGEMRYYNAKGENLKKALLISPLAFTRLTSKFTHNRKHPILGGTRPHLGVDYAAPMGTPVKAVGDGVVSKRGWAGGYGNQIIVKHNANLESMYAHLSGYARGLREGQKVRQGQVIGFVGSTGLSTGPHLDFRLRHKGEFINPAKAINPREDPVADALLPQFRKSVALRQEFLDGRPLPAHYTLDSIVPSHVSLPKEAKVARGRATLRSGKRIANGRNRALSRSGRPVRIKLAQERKLVARKQLERKLALHRKRR